MLDPGASKHEKRMRAETMVTRRIYISMTADGPLVDEKNRLKWGIVEKIEALGYSCEIFAPPLARPGLAAGQGWSMKAVDQVARRCIGGVLIGMPRWQAIGDGGLPNHLASEFCHYEGAVLHTLQLPMLVFADADLERRGVFSEGAGYYITPIPFGAGYEWTSGPTFSAALKLWAGKLAERRDLFLGYCSTSGGTARNLKRYLEKDLHASVLDWQTDFDPGSTILDQIAKAAELCSGGIFLFTRDDNLENDLGAAPRDNVVFEAGYFGHAKGHDRILIVREIGSKMPADLGGQIYASLADRTDISPIEQQVRRFVERL